MALNQILLRGDTSAAWVAANPILAAREMAIDTTEHRVKVGDGVSAWTSLPWTSMAASEVTRLEAAATALVGAASPTDAVNETLIKDPASKTAVALTSTIGAEVQGSSFLPTAYAQVVGVRPSGGDDTAQIQAAIDTASANAAKTGMPSIVLLSAGTFIAAGIQAKPYVTLAGQGMWATKIKSPDNSTALGIITMPAGPIAGWFMRDLWLASNGVANQSGIYMKAVAAGSGNSGGWWYGGARNIRINGGFSGPSMWLRGGSSSTQTPHQFLTFENIIIFGGSTSEALRLTGQVGQVTFVGGEYDGPGQGTLTARPCVFIGREVEDNLSIKSDDSPYAVKFITPTVQSAKKGVKIERARAIFFDNPYFENLDQAFEVSASAPSVVVDQPILNNAAHALANDATGYGFKVGGTSRLFVRHASFAGAVDSHFQADVGSSLMTTPGQISGSLLTSGMTKQLSVAADGSLTIDLTQTALVNASSTAITTITSGHTPGQMVTLRASGGTITLGSGGNISLAGNASPLVLPSGSGVALVRMDAGTTWQVVGLSVAQRPLTGTAAPASPPNYVGQEYLDTSAKRAYRAFGTSTAADWVALN